jgi:3-deoxy-manno-octulosonate cytidylyltransferase (CMP-KDO synthetase)
MNAIDISAVGFTVAIPARMDATRLPGKPLRMLAGEPLILHVVRRALDAGASEVVVATDDVRIAEALWQTQVRVCMTGMHHASGSDRLADCADQLGWDDEHIVVNLQGDEPFAPPQGIRAVAQCLADRRLDEQEVPMATLAARIESADALFDPNVVKLVRAANGDALYFSRAPIPWHRDAFARDRLALPAADWLRHIGIYAYRAGFLRRFAAMPQGRLERIESLEQLRALEAGVRIAVAITPVAFPPGVDTEADLERAEARFALERSVRQAS